MSDSDRDIINIKEKTFIIEDQETRADLDLDTEIKTAKGNLINFKKRPKRWHFGKTEIRIVEGELEIQVLTWLGLSIDFIQDIVTQDRCNDFFKWTDDYCCGDRALIVDFNNSITFEEKDTEYKYNPLFYEESQEKAGNTSTTTITLIPRLSGNCSLQDFYLSTT